MSHYQHLSIKERESIWENRIKGKTLSEIAAMIGRSIATVSRELKRNSRNGTAETEPIGHQRHRPGIRNAGKNAADHCFWLRGS